MHPTTIEYLANARRQDLETEAAKARLAAEARKHDADELRPMRWGIRLPHLVPHFPRRHPATGAATA
jgi:hypothetical protein